MKLYKKGLSYSTINTARSALSTVVEMNHGCSIGTHPLVSRFVKGVYQSRTPTPKYSHIWDVSKVLGYLGTLYPNKEISLKNLTLKLVMLLLLVTGKRGQDIHLLSLQGMKMLEASCEFKILYHTKTSRPGNGTNRILIAQYEEDKKICPLETLVEYLGRTKVMRNDEQGLFISYIKPHHKVSRDTISRWAKSVLESSGIDTAMFTAHSTRAAAASKAKQKAIPLDVILKTVGWKSANTFHKFYDKPITDTGDMGAALLSSKVS